MAIAATTVVAVVAAMVSYDHMRTLGERAGEGWKAWLIPLAIDGMVVAASTVLLVRRRAARPGGVLAWLALLGGVLASLAANAAAAQPTLVGRAIALVPPLALAVSFELVRSLVITGVPAGDRPAPDSAPVTWAEAGEDHQPAPATLEERAAALVAEGQRTGQPVGRGRLARELGISEHQARQLLATLTTESTTETTEGRRTATSGTLDPPRRPERRPNEPGAPTAGAQVREPSHAASGGHTR